MGGHSDHAPKTSISEAEIRKILARAKTQTFSEVPKYAQSPTSGVKLMWLNGRFANERARLGPDFTEADRQWRIKYIKSLDLHPAEPFHVPNLLSSHLNPIRRFYRAPLDIVERALAKKMHPENATVVRKIIGRSIIGYLSFLFFYYQLKYNTATWEECRGIRIHHSREAVYPGDFRYPMPNPRSESWQHYDREFHKRKVFLNE